MVTTRIRKGAVRNYSARAIYDQIEDALTSITMQLRSAIEADAHRPPRVNGKANGASGPGLILEAAATRSPGGRTPDSDDGGRKESRH